ncbi:MAG TPA: sialidase family protein, partial [Acidimicrobiales bacterium]
PPGLEEAQQLVATGAETAYVVAGTTGARDFEVLATDDGGATWRRAPAPCRGDGVRIEPLSPTHLWFRCSRVHSPSVHAQSFDGGRTWERPHEDASLAIWAPYSLLRSDDSGRSWRIAYVT